MVPIIAMRPVEHMTALGAPVEPEVNSSASRVWGSRASSGWSLGSAPAWSVSSPRHCSESMSNCAAVPVSRPSSRAVPSESVTITSQSTPRMSEASSAPRRVGLMPTMDTPASAAPHRTNRYSGTFSSRMPTWRCRYGAGRSAYEPACSSAQLRRISARTAASATNSRQVHAESSNSSPGWSSVERSMRMSPNVACCMSCPGLKSAVVMRSDTRRPGPVAQAKRPAILTGVSLGGHRPTRWACPAGIG